MLFLNRYPVNKSFVSRSSNQGSTINFSTNSDVNTSGNSQEGISVKKQFWQPKEFGVHSLAKVFPPILYYSFQGEWVVKTTPAFLIPLLTFLKKHSLTYYRQLRDISAVDHPKRKLRFEVLYQLLSVLYNQRLTVSVSVPEGTAIDSATSVYSSAG